MVCFFLYDTPGLRQDLPGVIRSIALDRKGFFPI